MTTLATWEGIPSSMPSLSAVDVRSNLQQQSDRFHQLWSRETHGCRHSLAVKAWLSFRETRRGLLAQDSNFGVECSWVNYSTLVRLRVFDPYRLTMSSGPLASRFSTIEVIDDFDEQDERLPSSLDAVQRHDASNVHNEVVDSLQFKGGGHGDCTPKKRGFCKGCDKASLLCICNHVKTLVKNRTSIIILQHPEEKRHHLGTARIALLALQNAEIISIPEVDDQSSIRMREKVPGSKRFIAGRGGKKAQNVKEELKNKKVLSKCLEVPPASSNSHSEQQSGSQHSPNLTSEEGRIREENTTTESVEEQQLVQWRTVPPWVNLQPDAGLLFPSEKAVILRPASSRFPSNADFAPTSQSTAENLVINEKRKGIPSNSPSQLIVLDGTWSKAKRIFFENPWLHSLPHYRLSTLQHSRYGNLRPEPKPGFLSTVESIVYALQVIEPETEGLGSLLDVFDAMIEDQVRLQEERCEARS